MPRLDWIGKQYVVNHAEEVPFRLLRRLPEASVGEDSRNMVVHGDNLEALKALMPYYRERVKLVFIDPPYNTGNEGWSYNDRMNAPKIKQWFGKVVGGEGEDLSRHDKWLCMMYPRLEPTFRTYKRAQSELFVAACNLFLQLWGYFLAIRACFEKRSFEKERHIDG